MDKLVVTPSDGEEVTDVHWMHHLVPCASEGSNIYTSWSKMEHDFGSTAVVSLPACQLPDSPQGYGAQKDGGAAIQVSRVVPLLRQ